MIKNMVGVFTQIEKLEEVAGAPKENVNPENVLKILGTIEDQIDCKIGDLLEMIK